MNPQLISISRRTDIPAFYGDWFMQRVAEGFAGWENPFGGRRQLVSLQRADTCHQAHDPAAAFLGYTQKESDQFVAELRTEKEIDPQMNLPLP